MRKVELEPHEWGQVMQIISTAPWNVANGLLVKIGAQLREQELPRATMFPMSEQMLEQRMKDGSAS
jgi:hypothetical protein